MSPYRNSRPRKRIRLAISKAVTSAGACRSAARSSSRCRRPILSSASIRKTHSASEGMFSSAQLNCAAWFAKGCESTGGGRDLAEEFLPGAKAEDVIQEADAENDDGRR